MTDLTPLFRQCVQIVENKFESSVKTTGEENPQKNDKNKNFLINDTFNKECMELFFKLLELKSLIEEIRPTYLAQVDESLQAVETSENDKNQFDEELKFQIQQLYQKLKIIQTYEQSRESKVSEKEKGWMNDLFGGEDETQSLFEETIVTHRTRILKYLNDLANKVNVSFDVMRRQRLERQKKLHLLNFQNLDDDLDVEYTDYLKDTSKYVDEEQSSIADASFAEDGAPTQLSQEQIQMLDQENQEFLDLKTDQLNKVKNLHRTMVDISSLQAELSYQLEVQSDKVQGIIDNQGEIEMDVTMGNQKLRSATGKNKRGSNILVLTCISMGILILFLDYIS